MMVQLSEAFRASLRSVLTRVTAGLPPQELRVMRISEVGDLLRSGSLQGLPSPGRDGLWGRDMGSEYVESWFVDHFPRDPIVASTAVDGGPMTVFDGRQRMRAIWCFLQGELPVVIDGCTKYFAGGIDEMTLTDSERESFLAREVRVLVLPLWPEKAARTFASFPDTMFGCKPVEQVLPRWFPHIPRVSEIMELATAVAEKYDVSKSWDEVYYDMFRAVLVLSGNADVPVAGHPDAFEKMYNATRDLQRGGERSVKRFNRLLRGLRLLSPMAIKANLKRKLRKVGRDAFVAAAVCASSGCEESVVNRAVASFRCKRRDEVIAVLGREAVGKWAQAEKTGCLSAMLAVVLDAPGAMGSDVVEIVESQAETFSQWM